MSSKEQAHSNNESLLRHQAVRPKSQSSVVYDQPIAPVNAVRKAGVTPQLLTKRDVLQLQRMIGNQAVGRLMAQVIQRKPELEKDNIYKDDEYPDVKLEKLKPFSSSLYKIINGGPHKDRVIYYDPDDKKYFHTEEDARYGLMGNGVEFNISSVSSGPPVAASVPTVYDNIGEQGKGVGYVGTDTTLKTSGLITCVGWLLYNDKAAYLTHIVVLEPEKVVADGGIRKQVNDLYNTFVTTTESNPTSVHIQVDEEQFAYEKPQVWMSGWMRELVPDSCKVTWVRGDADLSHVVKASEGTRKEWNGGAIRVKTLEERISEDMNRYQKQGYSLF